MSRLRLAAIVLLVLSAGLFAISTSIEKNRHHDETSTAPVSESHGEGGESAEQREAEGTEPHAATTESSESKILGIDRESTGLVALAVIVSLALAALRWLRPNRAVWYAVGLITAAFAVFDIAEVIHQLDESAAGLALLAGVVGIAHATTAGIAAKSMRTSV